MAMTVAMFAIGLLAFFYAIGKLYAMAFVTRASAAKIAAPSYSVAMPRDGTFFNLVPTRSEEHTSELQSLMRISYAVFCLKKKTNSYTSIHRYTNILEYYIKQS